MRASSFTVFEGGNRLCFQR